MSAEAILEGLHCENPRCACQHGRQTHCPSHQDKHPSLSVDERDGRLLVHCHAGCSQEQVIDALRDRGLWRGNPPAPALSRLRRGQLEGPLNDVARFITRYVVLPNDHAVTALSLWVAHTHVLEAFDVTPYLIVKSPTKRSGKTRVLEVLELLVPRAWRVIRPSEAVLFRKIAQDHPTLLLDEADTIFASRNERTEPLRAVLNAGFRRGATVPRCVGDGSKMRLVDFDVFCAKAIAGIGDLPDTVEDRGIVVRMNRATPAEQRGITRLRLREAATEAVPIREALTRWAEAALPTLRGSRPVTPDELDGRAADAWEPLMAVADLAGDGWSVVAWEAALALSTGANHQDHGLNVRLLDDIRAVFEGQHTDRLATAALIKALCDEESAPWGDWHGKCISPQALSRLLRPFGIGPGTIRIGDGTCKGYQREDFEDAWGRYLAPSSPQGASEPSRSSHPLVDMAEGHFSEASHQSDVTGGEHGWTPRQISLVPGVTDESAPSGGAPTAVPGDDSRRLAVYRVGEGLGWPELPYAPGRSIASGREAWVAFVRANSDAEIALAWSAVEHVARGPE